MPHSVVVCGYRTVGECVCLKLIDKEVVSFAGIDRCSGGVYNIEDVGNVAAYDWVFSHKRELDHAGVGYAMYKCISNLELIYFGFFNELAVGAESGLRIEFY